MSREIKFRAWSPAVGVTIEVVDMRIVHGKLWVEGPEGEFDFMIEGECRLLEFTGLQDKNGVDIYEGDIVLDQGSPSQVIYQAPAFVMKVKPENTRWSIFVLPQKDRQFAEVIGNIYENPELIK